MARYKPDLDLHDRTLRPALSGLVRELRALHNGGFRPITLWLRPGDMCAIVEGLGGSGFDVARGVVFRGIPLKAYAG